MREFDMRGHHCGRRFGGHRFAKPLVIGVVLLVVLGLVVMSLWNAVLPAIVGVKTIGFWQALGLLVLCRILFGGLGFRPGMFGRHRRMHERWMQMTPEQRDEFIRTRREGFGRHGHRGHCGWRGREQDDEKPQATNPNTPDAE